MTMSAGVLDLQRRSLQIGRIRTGVQVDTGKVKNGKPVMRPGKLAVFRFTSPSRRAIEAVAALFGGTARPWMNGKRQEWEVITESSEISVTVPPRDAVISQHYEMWNAGGCVRRCNSQVQRNGDPCACPHAEDPGDVDEMARKALERADMARQNPPQACHLVTRISLNIPDLPGVGVWRLDTGSFYAAGEMIDQAQIMEMARDARVLLPAVLRIEQRTRVADGQRRDYPVPVLDLLPTLRQLASGELAAGGIAAQLPPAPGEQARAITTGTPAPKAPQPATAPAPKRTAKDIVADAWQATTREDIETLAAEAKALRVDEDHVCTSGDTDPEVYEELNGFLQDRWKALPAATGRDGTP